MEGVGGNKPVHRSLDDEKSEPERDVSLNFTVGRETTRTIRDQAAKRRNATNQTLRDETPTEGPKTTHNIEQVRRRVCQLLSAVLPWDPPCTRAATGRCPALRCGVEVVLGEDGHV